METSKRDILEGLNPAQADAVQCIEGPSLIIAGAGSGKTRVLTCRIAYLIDQGTRPSQVLALTFTKKAAGEMKERIGALVGESRARYIWMGTFHSVFIRFLREFADKLGYPQQFTIYDQNDSKSVIKQCIKELELDDKIYKPNIIQSRISLAKNNLVTNSAYRRDENCQREDRESRKPRVCDIYDLYTKKCKGAGAMDFDDILLQTNILFRDFPDALEEIAKRFTHVMVDEYQDTNFAQYLILKKLSQWHRNICVVGDDSQSIYSFRGARIENILRFQKDYPEAKVFRLEQNYRSTQTIVNAANSVIDKNSRRLKKECFSKADIGEKVHVINAFTDLEEARLTACSIVDRIYSDKAAYGDFAILYRTNAQSRAFEESLRIKNLPYRVYGGHSFYEREEIKDMIAYFKLIVNPKDDEAFRRIINKPARGLGDTSLQHLAEAASAAQVPLLEACGLPGDRLLSFGLKENAIRKFVEFREMILPLTLRSATDDAFTLAMEIGSKSGYVMSYKMDSAPESQARCENIQELFNGIKEYTEEEEEMRKQLAEEGEGEAVTGPVTLGDFLENIFLLSEAEKDDLTDENNSTNRITLMTVHASKGLEYPYVYIAGMEDGLFPPLDMFGGNAAEIEEERRLFYVALTRAEKAVTLSFAKNRKRWGKDESYPVSRFVKEIDGRYIDRGSFDGGEMPFFEKKSFPSTSATSFGNGKPVFVKSRPAPVQAKAARQPDPNFKPDPISELQAGQRVEHDRFGFGTIISFDGMGADRKAVVEFDETGRKTLLLKFAKLRIDR